MANPRVATGWDNAAGLADISYIPRVEYINPGRERIAGDGFTYEDGRESCELIFDILDEAQKAAVDAELGVDSAPSAKMTLRVDRNLDRAPTNYNVFIKRATGRHDREHWLGLSYAVYGMREI